VPTKKPKAPLERTNGDDADGISFDTYVPTLVARLANLLSSNASRFYRAQWGIGLVEWRIIHVLARQAHLNAREIAQRADLDKAAVSRGLRNLEQRGIVDIAQETPRARQIAVSLGKRGFRIYQEILKTSRAREALLLEGIAEAERQQLTRLLGHLIHRVPEMDRYQGGE
jgi:DNA-binding MarR family transcriptional regulator